MEKKTKTKRIPRSLIGMLKTLQSQTDLLKDYYHKAFVEKKTIYLGEIAGKLRLLVIDEGTNKALLLRLMKEFDDEFLFTLNGPPGKSRTSKYQSGDKISIQEFLNIESHTSDEAKKRKTTGIEIITKRDLIKRWSQQLGSAHQDWAVDEDLHKFLKPEVYFGGIPLQGLELKATTKIILDMCELFLSKHKKDLVGTYPIDENWNELLEIYDIHRLDDGNSYCYTFRIYDHESLRNKEEFTIAWYKDKDSSVFRLKKENTQFVLEQISPESMIRQCSLNLDKIRQEPRYQFLLKSNKNEIKLFVRYRDGTYVSSDDT